MKQPTAEGEKLLCPSSGPFKKSGCIDIVSATPDQLFAGKGTELFDLLEKELRDTVPGIEIVPYRELPMKFAPEDEVIEAIVASRPDGVVAGFGG
ncbi:MAG: hypothetical protein P8Z37_18145 [Acidobacteriota bacterium]